MNKILKASKKISIFLLCIMLHQQSVFAIDNPESASIVEDFEKRAKPFEEKFSQQSSNSEILRTGAEYSIFLDIELNKTYQSLLQKIDPISAKNLTNAQRAWLNYRKEELNFIEKNWTSNNFGSSYIVSRIDYKNSMTKNRIIMLIRYLQNY